MICLILPLGSKHLLYILSGKFSFKLHVHYSPVPPLSLSFQSYCSGEFLRQEIIYSKAWVPKYIIAFSFSFYPKVRPLASTKY